MAERKTYSAEQKAEALKKVAELGITKAAKELGISHVTLAKWRVDAGVDTAKKKVEKAAKDVADQAAATTIEAKKNGRAAGRKAKEKIKQVAEELISYEKIGCIINRVTNPELVGLTDSPVEILSAIPADDAFAANDIKGRSVMELPADSVMLKGVKEALRKIEIL